MQKENHKKYRIGMILDAAFPPDPRVENEALSLIEQGHQVFLFCFSYKKKPQKTYETFKQIKICRYPCSKIIYKLSALAYTLPFYSMYWHRKIKHFIVKNNIEILHIHDIQIAASCFKALERIKKPIPTVLDLHENRPEIMKYYQHLQTPLGKLFIKPERWKRAEKKYVSKADYILVVTPQSKKELSQRIPEKKDRIIAIPNTTRADFSNNVRDTKHPTNYNLLYIGDTGYRRGLPTAIKALPLLKKHMAHIALHIVGKSSYDTTLKALVKNLNLQKEVIFYGWQPAEKLVHYIQNSWVCLSPLHRNKHHDTTYANKLFQYMHCGKGLLVSDATAQKELVLKNYIGLVHLAEDTNDFAEKVLQLYKNPTLLNQFGANAQRLAKHDFCWEKTVRPLLKIYESL